MGLEDMDPIVRAVQSSSVVRMNKVKIDMSIYGVHYFKGDDENQYATHAMQISRDLENGQELPKHLVVSVVDHLIEVPIEKFSIEFLSIRPTHVQQRSH
jgi:hypothetical protein